MSLNLEKILEKINNTPPDELLKEILSYPSPPGAMKLTEYLGLIHQNLSRKSRALGRE